MAKSLAVFWKLACLFALFSIVLGAVDDDQKSSIDAFEGNAANLTVRSESDGGRTIPGRKLCRNPRQRKEWRDLHNREKAAYISAVKCLQRLPAVTRLPGVRTRFDDFQAVHVALTYEIHWVGQFIHWHRRMLHAYELALRDHCHYRGSQPYWDWTRDADTGNVTNSPIFDPITGFGGNGALIPNWTGFFGNSTPSNTGGGCLIDGPFKGFNLSVGPGSIPTNHCLVRSIKNTLVNIMTTAQVQNTTKQPTFELFRQELGGAFRPPPQKVHDGGHGTVGGEMGNVFSSPGDPLFYLHHAGLDRVWWLWQEMDREHRLTDVSGNTVYNTTTAPLTLDFPLRMDRLAPTVPIRNVMDTRGEFLCYTYV